MEKFKYFPTANELAEISKYNASEECKIDKAVSIILNNCLTAAKSGERSKIIWLYKNSSSPADNINELMSLSKYKNERNLIITKLKELGYNAKIDKTSSNSWFYEIYW